jgi:hypothetical protein
MAVIADNESHLIHLPNAIQDPTMAKSIISKSKAFATHSPITQITPLTLRTHGSSLAQDHIFTSDSTITLRWRSDHSLQSFEETFYIIDSLPHGVDVILRKDIPGLLPHNTNQGNNANSNGQPGSPNVGLKVLHMAFSKPGKKGEKDKQDKEALKAQRTAEWEAQVVKQTQSLKMKLVQPKKK